jgi:transglutaminase-like putative cysteine protease
MTARHRRLPIALGLAFAWAPGLAAQAPVVGPEGDPSVDSDTIYALVVDPADHPEENTVLLLDDGIVVVEEDGRGSRTYRMVAQLLNREAVDTWAEHTFSYDGDREAFTLNWVRVLDLDGNVISDEPIHQQVMDMPVPEQSPVYTNWKRVRVSLGGVEPGTIVDYSYTVETLEPVMPGDHFSNWSISTGGTVRRSRLVLDVPEGHDIPVVEENLWFEPRVTTANGRRVVEWAAADLEWIEPEYFPAIIEADFMARLAVGGATSWAAIGAWYAGLAADRYGLEDGVIAAANQITADATTDDERLARLYKWIAQDFRYISISLGRGGYQPRPPAEVFSTLSGDCKDKATLFIALAREMGFEAYPVLLNSGGGVEEKLPSVQQFNHAIAAVRRDEGWLFLDLTAEVIPVGEISPSYQGEFGIVVLDDGTVEEVTFPENDPSENRTEVLIEGALAEDGSFEGRYTEISTGALQYGLRSQLARDFTQRELDLAADAIAGGVLDGALGDSLTLFHGHDLDADVSISLKVAAPRVGRSSGNALVLTLPIETFGNAALVAGLEEELATRRYPIDVAQVVGPVVRERVFRVRLPAGWTAQLPESVRVASRFGTYTSEYTQEGQDVRVMRRVEGFEGTEPPEALPDLIEFLRAIGEDDVTFLLIERAG